MNIIEKVGEGSFGVVYKVEINGKHYAVKKNFKNQSINGTTFLRELYFINIFKNNPFFIKIIDIYYNEPCEGMDDEKYDMISDNIYIVTDFIDMDVFYFIYELGSPVKYIKKIFIDICLALLFMHNNNYVHRDLKPGNILLLYNNDVDKTIPKLCDFGFTKKITRNNRPSTPKVVTSWYRAPEVIQEEYQDEKVDIWSLGTILFELLAVEPLFNGENERDIMKKIMEMRPKLYESDISFLKGKNKVIPCGKRSKKNLIEFINTKRRKEINKNFGNLKDINKLLEYMLEINPKNRISVEKILENNLFDDYREYINENKNKYIIDNEKITVLKFSENKENLEECIKILDKINTKVKSSKKDVLFLTLDILYRYMNLYNMEMDEKRKIYVVFACYYISYKYYNIFININVDNLFEYLDLIDMYDDSYYEKIEKEILELINYKIPFENIYNILENDVKLNDNEIYDLYEIYKNIPYDEVLDVKELVDNYIKIIDL